MGDERPGEVTLIEEAGAQCDVGQPRVGLEDEAVGRFEAATANEGRRADSVRAPEGPHEVAGVYVELTRERVDSNNFAGVGLLETRARFSQPGGFRASSNPRGLGHQLEGEAFHRHRAACVGVAKLDVHAPNQTVGARTRRTGEAVGLGRAGSVPFVPFRRKKEGKASGAIVAIVLCVDLAGSPKKQRVAAMRGGGARSLLVNRAREHEAEVGIGVPMGRQSKPASV